MHHYNEAMGTILASLHRRTKLLVATVAILLRLVLLRTLYEYAADWVPPRAYDIVVATSRCPGALAKMLAERARSGLVVSIEESREAALIASRRVERKGLGGKVDVLVGDRSALPLRSCCADTIVSVGVLRYVEKAAKFLAESLRVLRPEGRAVAIELVCNASRREFEALSKRLGSPALLLRLGATLYGLLRESSALSLPSKTLRTEYGSVRLWAEPAVSLILLSRVTRRSSQT